MPDKRSAKKRAGDARRGAATREERMDFRLDPDHEITTLSDRDLDRFVNLLDHPPAPTEALRRAARRHREVIVRSE